uniref:Uncharacterized protein n=1 Tax=Arundo donax TaxID=35708 RepID=A0A0A9H260_ARUDO
MLWFESCYPGSSTFYLIMFGTIFRDNGDCKC